MPVRMVSQSTLTVSLLDLFLRRTTFNAKDLVIVFSFAEFFESFGFFKSGLVFVGSVELDNFLTVSNCCIMLVSVLVTVRK